MSFRFGESPDSRTGGNGSETRKYFAYGTTDAAFVRTYAKAAIPPVIVVDEGILYRQDVTIDSWDGPYCQITATFGKQQSEEQVGSLKWGFDGTGGTVNIKASRSTTSYPAGAPDHGGSIGVGKDGDVEGCEIIIPSMKFNVSYTHPKGFITLSRAFQLGDAIGKSNSNTFFTKPAGSFLFIGVRGSDGTDSDAEVSYEFAYSENLQSDVIGGITVAEKDGWDYAWIQFKDDIDANSKPIRKPVAVHVERVYERINYSSVVGFG